MLYSVLRKKGYGMFDVIGNSMSLSKQMTCSKLQSG